MHDSEEHDIFGGAAYHGEFDSVSLNTIGIDVGSTTFHFMFARLKLQRGAHHSRFEVVEREVLWRSPIFLTPYVGSHIDATAVSHAIKEGHEAAEMPPDHIDSGAIILTGEALRTDNARALGEAIAEEAGKFVCVSAGHHLESMLAAFGSGAVGVARERDLRLLHVDVGGGTTKLSFIDPSGVRQTAAINGGGRIVALDEARRIVRMSAGARPLARHAEVDLTLGETLSPGSAERLVEALADAITGIVNKQTKGTAEPRLRLTNTLKKGWKPEAISFSGGVSEYIYGREERDFGDLGPLLARAIQARFADRRLALPLLDPGEGIRATVIGAAQSSVQVSGNTVAVSKAEVLPLHNIPVVHPHFDTDEIEATDVAAGITQAMGLYGLTTDDSLALSISWSGTATYARLHELAKGISAALGDKPNAPIAILIDADIAGVLGRFLAEDFLRARDVVCLDGLHLSPFDYVDIGKVIDPPGVLPVVIKSLLFDVQHHGHAHR